MTHQKPNDQDRSLRIIGGNWRGRKVTFQGHDGIRPTGDRVRETLFNWLMHDIRGAHCLDLFAGSGILSIEALSRGASHVSIVEQDRSASHDISGQLERLTANPDTYTNICADALSWLEACDTSFDIIFIDPPFATDLLPDILRLVSMKKIARNFVYIETPNELSTGDIPDHWNLYRQKRAAAVHYCLCITG